MVKYDRNGFRPRLRQLIFTQEAAYLVEEAKIKQRISYGSLKGQQRENLHDDRENGKRGFVCVDV